MALKSEIPIQRLVFSLDGFWWRCAIVKAFFCVSWSLSHPALPLLLSKRGRWGGRERKTRRERDSHIWYQHFSLPSLALVPSLLGVCVCTKLWSLSHQLLGSYLCVCHHTYQNFSSPSRYNLWCNLRLSGQQKASSPHFQVRWGKSRFSVMGSWFPWSAYQCTGLLPNVLKKELLPLNSKKL